MFFCLQIKRQRGGGARERALGKEAGKSVKVRGEGFVCD